MMSSSAFEDGLKQCRVVAFENIATFLFSNSLEININSVNDISEHLLKPVELASS